MEKNRWIALTIALLCVMSLLLLVGCGDSESDSDEVKQPNVNEAYVEHLAGKTFLPKNGGGSFLTFYQEGVATYDYGSDHYGYYIDVVETTETQIKMHLRTVVIQSDDYIEREYSEATYNIADNTIYYFQPYICLYDPENSDFYSNAYGSFCTVCAQPDCKLLIAPSGNTKYCSEHAGKCEFCHEYLDPGVTYCDGCPYCHECKVKIKPGSGSSCDACLKKMEQDAEAKLKKCVLCQGTGYMKMYYGSSDLEAYLNGYMPYWFVTCTSCKGKGKC